MKFTVLYLTIYVSRFPLVGSIFAAQFNPVYVPPKREFGGGAGSFPEQWLVIEHKRTLSSLTYHVRYSEGSSKHKQTVDIFDERQFAIG